jgi:hypothetical protein
VENRDRFTLSVPLSNKWLPQAIDDIHETVDGPEGYPTMSTTPDR